jgi:phosphohistidine phosphatase
VLLLLARHADAGVPDPARWPGDADRPLTDLGRATQRAAAQRLVDGGMAPSAIVSSPLLRARQTAEIIAEVCSVTAPIALADALAATPNVSAIAKAVAPFADSEVVALTGHSPWMDEFASLLLVGSTDGLRTEFSKSAVMAIRIDAISPGTGQLVAFLQP